jgi:hypothetical protein
MATPTTKQKVRLEAKADGEQLPVVNLLLLQSSSFHIAVSERLVVTRGPFIIIYHILLCLLCKSGETNKQNKPSTD